MQIRQVIADLGIQVGEADLQAVETALEEYLQAVDALGPSESAGAHSSTPDLLDGWLAPDAALPESRPVGRVSALKSAAPVAADGAEQNGLAAAAHKIVVGESSPVDLIRSALAQIARAEPSLHAFVTRIDVERCMDLARQAEFDIEMGDYRGRLHGIPLAVPDSHAVEGVRQEAGAPHLQRWVPSEDAT
ncbi:MAG: amidase, partial [Chloroflexi bacterium]|nr:amidase [Chloroflexota bacterium]